MSRGRSKKDGKKRVSNVWGAGAGAVKLKLHQFLSKMPPRRLPNDMQGNLCARRAQDESGNSVEFYLLFDGIPGTFSNTMGTGFDPPIHRRENTQKLVRQQKQSAAS